jgi:hypothetical protein
LERFQAARRVQDTAATMVIFSHLAVSSARRDQMHKSHIHVNG